MLLLQLLSKTESDSGSSTFTNSYQHCHKPLPETGSDPGSATVKKLLQEVWSDPGCATVTNPYYRLDLIQDVLLSQTPTRDWIWSRKFYCHKTFTRDWIWSRKCYCHKPLLETGSDPGCATVTKPLPEKKGKRERIFPSNWTCRIWNNTAHECFHCMLYNIL